MAILALAVLTMALLTLAALTMTTPAHRPPELVRARAAFGGGGGGGAVGGGSEVELLLLRGSEAERTYSDGTARGGPDGATRLGLALMRAWDPRRPSGGLLGMMSAG